MRAHLPAAAVVVALMAGCAGVGLGVPSPTPVAPAGDEESARLAEQLARCQQLQREERRKREQLAQQLREERHKSEAMQRKIDSLRAIDREMMLERRVP